MVTLLIIVECRVVIPEFASKFNLKGTIPIEYPTLNNIRNCERNGGSIRYSFKLCLNSMEPFKLYLNSIESFIL